jgi:hypothetical protein
MICHRHLVAELLFALGFCSRAARALLGSATPHLAYVIAVFGPYARIPSSCWR